MTKRMMTAFAALMMIMTTVLVAFTPVSAQARDINYTTAWKCETYYNITTCMYVEWHKQADTDGVRLEGFKIWTSTGCPDLGSGGKPQYFEVTGKFYNLNYIDYAYNFGDEPYCTFYKDLSNAGLDTGPMDFYMKFRANVLDWGDKDVKFDWHLQANGNWALKSSSVG